jgi:hypothetical protein
MLQNAGKFHGNPSGFEPEQKNVNSSFDSKNFFVLNKIAHL